MGQLDKAITQIPPDVEEHGVFSRWVLRYFKEPGVWLLGSKIVGFPVT